MAEVLFYHLEYHSLDTVLPSLLEKTLERGWRAVVESDNKARLEALDAGLWTYKDESFLPHCMGSSEKAEITPIVLSMDEENKNSAEVRFYIDGSKPQDIDNYERVVIMFDGRDEEATDSARELWKTYQDSEHTPTYWKQNKSGKWEKKA